MKKTFSATAKASATVANQPAFDRGGFPVKVLAVLHGSSPTWETLFDKVTVDLKYDGHGQGQPVITIANHTPEIEGPSPLPTDPEQHTAGRAILFALRQLKGHGAELPSSVRLRVTKGLSLRGTGLGSSGATPAAALKTFLDALQQTGEKFSLSEEAIMGILREADFGVPDNAIPAYFGGMNLLSENARKSVATPADFFFILATPLDFGIETQKARALLKGFSAPSDESVVMAKAVSALEQGDLKGYAEGIASLHKWFVGEKIDADGKRSMRSSLYPGQGRLYTNAEEAAKRAGALELTISGAGPTLIALLPHQRSAKKIADAIAGAFAKEGQHLVIRLCQVDPEGAEKM